MENKSYWELFWQTGLPEAWLLSRWEEMPEAVAAFEETEHGDAPV